MTSLTDRRSLGACRRNAKREHSASDASHFGAISVLLYHTIASDFLLLWGCHPTFSGGHYFSDRLLGARSSPLSWRRVRVVAAGCWRCWREVSALPTREPCRREVLRGSALIYAALAREARDGKLSRNSFRTATSTFEQEWLAYDHILVDASREGRRLATRPRLSQSLRQDRTSRAGGDGDSMTPPLSRPHGRL